MRLSLAADRLGAGRPYGVEWGHSMASACWHSARDLRAHECNSASASAAGRSSRKGQSRGADRPRTASVSMLLRGLSMSARLAGLAASALVLTTLASPAGALSERERADQIATVAVLCELILSEQDPNPDEGRRITEELLAKLEGEVGDPSLVVPCGSEQTDRAGREQRRKVAGAGSLKRVG